MNVSDLRMSTCFPSCKTVQPEGGLNCPNAQVAPVTVTIAAFNVPLTGWRVQLPWKLV